MRCLTLADAVMEVFPNARCRFWVSEEGLDFPALKNSSYDVVTSRDFYDPVDLLVVDDYDLDAKFEAACRVWAKTILVIDDLAKRSHDCDILLDQTYGRAAQDYKPLVPDHARILCGAEYALLRPRFADLREQSLGRREKLEDVKKIVISLGSMNLHNISSRVLQAFQQIDGAYDMTVVLSAYAQDLDQVLAILDDVNDSTEHSCALALDVGDMAQLMADSDFAIGAGGTTTWERACLGLPSAVVELADNQSDIIQFLADKQALIPLGHYSGLSSVDTCQTLMRVLNCGDTLRALSQISADICDGAGTQRVIEEVKALYL